MLCFAEKGKATKITEVHDMQRLTTAKIASSSGAGDHVPCYLKHILWLEQCGAPALTEQQCIHS